MTPGYIGTTLGFLGIHFVVTENLPKVRQQYRRPRSRSKRIRKKWAKNERNWRTVEKYPNGVLINTGTTRVLAVSKDRHWALMRELCS